MSLQIYVDETTCPQDKKYVKDVDAFFDLEVKLRDTAFTRLVISKIEQGQYLNEFQYIDRFGTALYRENMSTTSKILLSVSEHPEYVFCGDELGLNGHALLFRLREGSILFNGLFLDFGPGYYNVDVEYNGKKFSRIGNLNDELGRC